MPALCKRKDLSIIIPVYNLEYYIQPMLDSLKEQNVGNYNIEIIFVLNNCTDHTEDVIRASRIPCHITYCTTQGCGPARNKALELATGEYLWFMDGDDWLLSDTAVKDALDAVKGQDIMRIPFKSARFTWDYFSMVWQYIMRREFVKEFQFPDYQPAEDDAYMEMVLRKAGYNRYDFMKMPALSKPLYFYNYLREGSNMYQVNVLGRKI